MRCLVNGRLLLAVSVCCTMIPGRSLADQESGVGRSEVIRQVEAALQRATGGTESYKDARRALEALASSEVIPAIVDALANPTISQRADMRKLAYSILAYHKAATTKVGYNQLMAGLNDPTPSIQRVCCAALDSTHLAKELNRLSAILVDKTTPERKKEAILRQLVGWGRFARSALDTIEAMFADTEEGERVRWFAARAMLNIGGLRRAMQGFQNLDPTGEKVVMWSFARYIGENTSDGKHLEPEEAKLRPNVQRVVFKALQSPDADVQKAAMEAMAVVYNQDLVVIRSREDYELNPELRPILEEIAENHPDSGLRDRVRDFLSPETVDRMVAMILRERQRQAEPKGK